MLRKVILALLRLIRRDPTDEELDRMAEEEYAMSMYERGHEIG